MEKIKTTFDGSTNKAYFKRPIICAIVGFVYAFCVFCWYGLNYIITKEPPDTFGTILSVLSAVLVVFGITYLVLIFKTIRTADKNRMETVSEFFDEYIFVEVYKNEEKIQETKFYYDTIASYRVVKDYIFLKVNNNTVFPISNVPGAEDFLRSKSIKKKK